MQPDAAAFSVILTEGLGAGEYPDAFDERKISRSFRLQEGSIHEAGVAVTVGVGCALPAIRCQRAPTSFYFTWCEKPVPDALAILRWEKEEGSRPRSVGGVWNVFRGASYLEEEALGLP